MFFSVTRCTYNIAFYRPTFWRHAHAGSCNVPFVLQAVNNALYCIKSLKREQYRFSGLTFDFYVTSLASNFAYYDRCYRSVVCLSVAFMHCAQRTEDIDTMSFAYDSPMSLPDRVKIWPTLVDPFLPKFYPKLTHPCWFERRRHSIANKRPNVCMYVYFVIAKSAK